MFIYLYLFRPEVSSINRFSGRWLQLYRPLQTTERSVWICYSHYKLLISSNINWNLVQISQQVAPCLHFHPLTETSTRNEGEDKNLTRQTERPTCKITTRWAHFPILWGRSGNGRQTRTGGVASGKEKKCTSAGLMELLVVLNQMRHFDQSDCLWKKSLIKTPIAAKQLPAECHGNAAWRLGVRGGEVLEPGGADGGAQRSPSNFKHGKV